MKLLTEKKSLMSSIEGDIITESHERDARRSLVMPPNDLNDMASSIAIDRCVLMC